MTPAMITALAQNRAMATGFFELELPSGTRRLMLGSGEASYGGNTFKGLDATIGSVLSGDPVREDTTGEAPNTSLTIAAAPSADRSEIAGEAIQLSPVRIYLAALALDASSHLIAIADPEQLFDGFIDQAVIGLDKSRDDVDYSVISAFDFFFEDSEGQRLNGQFHKSIWPAELGLDNVTGVTRKIYWGTYGPGGEGGGISSGASIFSPAGIATWQAAVNSV